MSLEVSAQREDRHDDHHGHPYCASDSAPCPIHHDLHDHLPHGEIFWSATHVPHSPPTERPTPMKKCLPLNAPAVPEVDSMEVDEAHPHLTIDAMEEHALQMLNAPEPTWSIHRQPSPPQPDQTVPLDHFRFVHANASRTEWHSIATAAAPPPAHRTLLAPPAALPAPPREPAADGEAPRVDMCTPPSTDPGPGPFSPARFCPIGGELTASPIFSAAGSTEQSPAGPRALRPGAPPPPLCTMPAEPMRHPHLSGFGTPTGRGTPPGGQAAAVAAAAAAAGTQRSFSPAPGGPTLVPRQGPVAAEEEGPPAEGGRRGPRGTPPGPKRTLACKNAAIRLLQRPSTPTPISNNQRPHGPPPAAMPQPQNPFVVAVSARPEPARPSAPIPSGPVARLVAEKGSAAGLVRPTPRDPAFATGGPLPRPNRRPSCQDEVRRSASVGAALASFGDAPPAPADEPPRPPAPLEEHARPAPPAHGRPHPAHPESSPNLATPASRSGPQPGAFRPAIPELPSPR